MKSERIYTQRGRVLAGEVEKITLFDGKYNTAFRILDFTVCPQDISTSENVSMKVMTEKLDHSAVWFWARTSEIAWALFDRATSVSPGLFAKFDKDALIVEDLFLDATADSGEYVNYMITLEKVSMSEWLGALAMVRNSNQDV